MFIHEIDMIRTTLARLATLRTASVSEKDVYGNLAEQPEQLAQSLSRWHAHPENSVAVRLARAPSPGSENEWINNADGYAVGKPYTLDIDAIV